MSESTISIEAYLHTYDQLREAVEGLSEPQLVWKATESQWSVTEVLTHLVDHSIVVSFRIREVLAGSEARLPGFSQDSWVAGQRANGGKAEDALSAFWGLLLYNSQLFQRLSPEDWSRSAINFKGQTVTVAAIVQAFIDHVQLHLGQIDRIKSEERRSDNSSREVG
jgi:uncharacterized damage-inducible protein DinB